MSVAVLGILCMALLLIAAALWLWQSSSARTRRNAASAFVEQQLGRSVASVAAVAAPAPEASPGRAPMRVSGIGGHWDNLLLRAGMTGDTRFYAPMIGLMVILPLVALLFSGVLAAVIMAGLVVVGTYFRLWYAASKRNAVMVRQRPGLIDGLVRLITIGNSLGSAFHTAVPGVDRPLFDVLERANQLNRAGMELDASLFYVARLYRFRELELVAAVIGVALRFGGRSDMVLERMAGFMRDLQQAREELHALSAEVRLSAWILALLPIFVAGFIVIFNNAMFMGMWDDASGKKMLLGAVFLQVAGSFWLYRMAKSV